MNKNIIVFLLMMTFMVTSVYAQRNLITWERKFHDFGNIQKNVPAVFEFRFRNNTNETLRINSVISNCRCLMPYWENQYVAPNSWGSLRVTFLESAPGSFKQVLKVIVGEQRIPEYLHVAAEIGYSRSTKKDSDDPLITSEIISVPTSSPDLTAQFDMNLVNTAKLVSYMSEREKMMIAEINMVRSNPKGYTMVVNDYIKELTTRLVTNVDQIDYLQDEIATATELIRELEVLTPLPVLRPHPKLYQAAKRHGINMSNTANFNHRSSTGSTPLDRITGAAPDLENGAENLVARHYEVRRSVLSLLVDAGVMGRKHRKNILSPEWNFVASVEVGKVGEINDVWVQNFAKSKKMAISNVIIKPNKDLSNNNNVPGRTENNTDSKPNIGVPGRTENNTDSKPNIGVPGRTENNTDSKPNIGVPGRTENKEQKSKIQVPGRKTTTPKKEEITNTSITNVAVSSIATVGSPHFTPRASYLSPREQEMIDEINLLRSNPKGYILYINEHIKSLQKQLAKNPGMALFLEEEIEASRELIEDLHNTPRLSLLNPYKDMYHASKNHATDIRNMGNLTHVGSDGSYHWERIEEQAPDITSSAENLVGGVNSIRGSMIILLVDSGLKARTHRKSLLSDGWKFVSCFDIGYVGNTPNCWIQNFGK